MFKLCTLTFLSLLALAGTVNADRLIVEAEGTAFKTASLPNSVYQARAISNALKSALQSGAQSLDSFSLVENGKVLFDQISAQSNSCAHATCLVGRFCILNLVCHGGANSAPPNRVRVHARYATVRLRARTSPVTSTSTGRPAAVPVRKNLPILEYICQGTVPGYENLSGGTVRPY